MLTVALTGGIGSGKSTVAARLIAHGVPVLDADHIARDLVAPGQPVLADLVQLWGVSILTPEGFLDRRAVRERIFNDATARRDLEQLLHPRIREAMRLWLITLHAPYAVLVVPLLLETGQQDLAQRIWVVDAPESLRMARVIQRDGQTQEQVQAILATQCHRAQRWAMATEWLDNSGSLQHLIQQVDRLHHRYLMEMGMAHT